MNAVTERPRARRRLAEEYPDRVRPSKFAHVVLTTTNLPRARSWYLNVFDARVAYENDKVCFLTYDEEHHRIGLVGLPKLVERPPNSAGLEHLAFSFPTLGALLSQFRYLKSQGIAPYWTINHGPTISFYYRDPDGNKVELQHDVFATVAGIDAFFASGAYDENFMGIIIDPDELIVRYEAGEAMDSLTRRPLLPPGK